MLAPKRPANGADRTMVRFVLNCPTRAMRREAACNLWTPQLAVDRRTVTFLARRKCQIFYSAPGRESFADPRGNTVQSHMSRIFSVASRDAVCCEIIAEGSNSIWHGLHDGTTLTPNGLQAGPGNCLNPACGRRSLQSRLRCLVRPHSSRLCARPACCY